MSIILNTGSATFSGLTNNKTLDESRVEWQLKETVKETQC